MIRPSTFAIVVLALGTGVFLFLIKYQVQDLEQQLTGFNRDIAADREAIHVLKAEWSHLNEPTRLRALTERHLEMQPVRLDQVTTRAGIDEKLPQKLATVTAPPASFDAVIGNALGRGGVQ